MLNKLQEAVKVGEQLSTCVFVEARYDDLYLRTLQRINDNWKDIIVRSRAGVGITCYYKGASGYAYTASTGGKDIEDTVKRAFKLAKASEPAVSLKLEFDSLPAVKTNTSGLPSSLIKIHPRSKGLDYKIDMVNRVIESAREHGKNINTVRGLYGELFGQKLFTNSDGSVLDWEFEVIDLVGAVTSKTDDGSLVNGYGFRGGTRGLELYSSKGNTPEDLGKKAGLDAKEQLEAKKCPAGQFRGMVDSQLAGVLAHESFGHLSEGDGIVTNGSPLSEKVGERLGSDHVTIIDSGKPDIEKYGGLWVPFDDQGMEGGDTVILENGILKHFLHNRGTANKTGQSPTGNSRALHFGFIPIPRMTNTYFTPGDLSEEEALEQLGTGVYALESFGGQVEMSGFFVFIAGRGYWVENGEIKYPLREVSLTGNILDLLFKVEGATKELELHAGYFGGCGKAGQSPLPVGDGGPSLIISEVTYGGQA